MAGSVLLVSERCSTGNPVVSPANGIRTQCVRETAPGGRVGGGCPDPGGKVKRDGVALDLQLYLTFSVDRAS